MIYTDDILAKISSFGVLSYSIAEIAILLDIPSNEYQDFILEMQKPESQAYRSYHKGKLTGKYALDKELFDQAKGHDLTANTLMVERKASQKIDQTLHEMFKL